MATMEQQLLQTLQTGSVADKTSALLSCAAYVDSDIHFFAVTFLPVILPLAGKESDAGLRIQLLQLIDLVCAALGSGPLEVRYPVMAGCIEAVAVMFSDEAISVRKRLILSLTNMFPVAFRILCATPGDAKYWHIITILKTQVDALFIHENEGIRINAARYLSRVAIVQAPSDPSDNEELVSLNLIPVGHPYMNPQQLVAESVTLLDKFLTFLRASTQIQSTGAFLSSVINCLCDIITSRKQYAQPSLKVLLGMCKQPKPSHLSNFQYKNVQRTLKIVLLLVFPLPSIEPLQGETMDALEFLGTKTREIQVRLRRATKRSTPADFDEDVEDWKRTRFAVNDPTESSKEEVAALSAAIIARGVQKIPLVDAVQTIMNTLSGKTNDQLDQHIRVFLETEAIKAQHEKSMKLAEVQDPRLRAAAALQAANQPAEEKLDLVADALAYQTKESANALIIDIQAYMQLHKQQIGLIQAQTDYQQQHSDVKADRLDPGMEIKVEEDGLQSGDMGSRMLHPLSVDQTPTLAEHAVLSPDKRSELAVEALDRILAMESHFSVPTVAGTKPPHLIPKDKSNIIAARLGWMVIAIRVATRSSSNADVLRQRLLDFVLADFGKRVNFAILWLHEEQLLSESQNCHWYSTWFGNILAGLAADRGLCEDGDTDMPSAPMLADAPTDDNQPTSVHAVLDPRDRAYVRLLIEAPDFNSTAMDNIVACCESKIHLHLGVSALRDLIVFRPAVRDQCLDLLLKYCISSDKLLRSTAITTTRRLFENHTPLSLAISTFAVKQLTLLETATEFSQALTPAVESGDGGALSLHNQPDDRVDSHQSSDLGVADVLNDARDTKSSTPIASLDAEETCQSVVENDSWTPDDVVRHLELYLSLCCFQDTLLDEICSMYHKFPLNVHAVVMQQLTGLLRALAVHPNKLLSLISTFPDGAESVALKAIEVLLNTEHAVATVKQAVSTYLERQLDVRFLIIIMPYLDRARILGELPKLVMVLDGSEEQHAVVRAVFTRLISANGSLTDDETKKASLTPAELLIRIHQIDDVVGLKRCVEATSICFEMPDIFKQEVLAVTLQQLADLPTLPVLFMRTAMQSLGAYKGLVSFVNNILTRLVNRRIWTHTQIWQGFIRCCTIMFPSSISIILALPKPQALELISKSPKLHAALHEYIGQQTTQKRARRDFVVLGQLLSQIGTQ
ncbi:hypothetical protein BASA61_010335 [Batrachochytrium salamandrivorans]|nr:hypothetical protein BASA61_010335 [Batrachochytrium salamandrivorans]